LYNQKGIMRVTITRHVDGSISSTGFDFSREELYKPENVRLEDGCEILFSQLMPISEGGFTAHFCDSDGLTLYAVNINRQGIYVLTEDGHTFVEVAVPARELSPA
jgi:hypothetical protein